MTALRRMTLKFLGVSAAALSLCVGSPILAQSSDAPIDVTAAPPPSAETVGPSQLRNFNLQGTVTRPADQPAAAASQPVSTAPARARAGDAVPSEAAQPANPAASRNRPAAAQQLPVPSSARSPVGVSTEEAVTPSVPSEVHTNPAPQHADGLAPMSPALSSESSGWSWPWIAAVLALLAGGGFIAWSRRGKGRRHADPGRVAFAGLAREAASPESEREGPPVAPRPDPVPPRAQQTPQPQRPVPPQPKSDPKPPRPDDGLVVSTRLKPELTVTLLPDRIVVNEREVTLQYEVILGNSGAAPARDLLVEAKLVTAHAGQDREIAEFFQAPAGQGDRMPGISPLGKISLKSVVRLPLDQVQAFEAGGRRMFVPLVAFNLRFRAGGSDGQASASFLIGRGSEEDEKLAPIRLDLGPRIFRGLVARAHSVGLQPA